MFRSRRDWIALAAFVAAGLGPISAEMAWAAVSAPTSQTTRPRPNIVLIVADDHGMDAIGAYGNPIIKTPNLDRLAAQGTRFTSAFATTASCSPSRSVLLTGLQNHANGMYGLAQAPFNFQTSNRVRSLPVILSAHGYRTARIGKDHLAPASVYRFDQQLGPSTRQSYTIGRSPVEMARLCRELIRSTDQRPFFLYFATDDPHRLGPHDTSRPNTFGNRRESYPGITEVTYDPATVRVPRFLPDIAETRGELAQYYQSVSRIDHGVGALIEQLKDAGKYDDTIIIYLSDNGIAFPGAKTTLYDPGIRLPLIVKPAHAGSAGRVSDALVSWTDITPTILDYAGVAASAMQFHGASIRTVIEGEGAAEVRGRSALFGSHTFHEVQMYYPMRMIRTHRYKLIHNLASPLTFPSASDLFHSSTWQASTRAKILYGRRTIAAYLHRPEYELYDLASDPDESRNLATDPEYGTQINELKKQLQAFMRETDDPWLSKLDYE